MSRVLVGVTVLLACATLRGQQPFTAKTSLVVVPAVVVDKKGAIVEGLTQGDFQVFEDGKPVEVATFTAPRVAADDPNQSRFIVLALDNMTTLPEHAYRVKTIANRFVDHLGPYDVMSVIAINGGKAVTTNSKAELKQAVGKFALSGGAETMDGSQRAQHGLRMINSLTEQVVKAPHPRKVMVFVGSANLFSPQAPTSFDRVSAPNLLADWMDAVRATARNNVSVYVIDPRGPDGPYGDWADSFARETGGDIWARTSNFKGAVDQIFLESGGYYLIGYNAPVSDDKLHKIEVKVTKSGLTVRARKGRG